MNKEQIYEAVRLKGRVTRLSAFEKNIIDLTLEAVNAENISSTVKNKFIKLSNGMYAHTMRLEDIVAHENGIFKELADSKALNVQQNDVIIRQRIYRKRAFSVGLIIGGLIVGIVLTAIFL